MRPKGAPVTPNAPMLTNCEPGTPISDRTLAAALARDLESGFEALAVAWQHRLYAFTLRMCGQHADAEEIAQETLVHAWQALADFDAERRAALHIRPWLFQIAVNLVRNQARSAKRSPTLSLDEPIPIYADEYGEPPVTRIVDDDPAIAPEESLERRLRLERLAALLLTLPSAQRLALTLHHIEGMGYQEIAMTVGLPVGTVKSHASRGAEALRRAIERDDIREAYREETEVAQ